MTKTVVLGATGMLGHKVCQDLAANGHHVVCTVRKRPEAARRYSPVFDGTEVVGGIDVLDDRAIEGFLEQQAPDFVVNAVGLVKQLDEASDPYLAVAINSLLPHRLARVCDRLGARLVHVSTDCVFDGRRGGYREMDLPDARDLYGRSKALGETTEVEPSAVTLRTSFIGRELTRPRHGLVEWFLAQRGSRVKGFSRVIYSGLTSLELARAIRAAIDAGSSVSGVLQVASEPISKYDLLLLIQRIYGLRVTVEPAAEPVSDRSLVPGEFAALTGYRPPSWGDMVRDMYNDPTPYDELARADSIERREEKA